MLSTFRQDLRFALRTLRKSPVFTTVAILSLSLGIGANTAIFTLMDQVLLRMLPVQNPQEIVMLDAPGPNQGRIHGENVFSYPMYRDFRDRNDVFSGVIARFGANLSMTYKGQTERVDGELVSGNYSEVLGVRAVLGRTLTPEDDRTPGAHAVAVLTHGYWQRRFGADPAILNQTINLNGQPMTVVGILAPGFRGIEVGYSADVMVPIMMKRQMTPTWDDLENRRSMWLHVLARLKPGTSIEQAQSGLNVLYKQILQHEITEISAPSERFRTRFLAKNIHVLPAHTGRSQLRARFSAPLWVLMAMVGLVLLIACANVANLLIARAAGRQKEIAIRLALGAGRRQILRQLLAESMVLALTGGAAGILVAAWTGDFLLAFLPFDSAARSFSTTPDARVLLFNFGVAVISGILFGLAPAVQAANPALASTLKDESASISSGSKAIRFRKSLVAAQIALSLLLLIGAGLFARSLYNLKSLDPGIRTDNVMAFSIDPSLNGYTQPRIQELFRRTQQDVSALPGVTSASLATVGLMTGDQHRASVKVEGYEAKEGEDMNPNVNEVGPGFFSTMGIALVAGREFTDRDGLTAPKVAIINETAARYFFADRNPIGKRIGFARQKTPDMEIVGVVKDDKSISLREKTPRHVYVPYMQQPDLSNMTFYVRTSSDPVQLANLLRRRVQNVDSNLPIYDMKTMQLQVDQFLFTERLTASLSAFFGFLATLLAAIGLYGVMAYTVARRTREIGIRVALGAGHRSVIWLVMREVAVLAAIGVLIGLPTALGLSRYIESQLYGITPHDPFTLASATLLLIGVSLLAGYIPAERATRVDPLSALRYE